MKLCLFVDYLLLFSDGNLKCADFFVRSISKTLQKSSPLRQKEYHLPSKK